MDSSKSSLSTYVVKTPTSVNLNCVSKHFRGFILPFVLATKVEFGLWYCAGRTTTTTMEPNLNQQWWNSGTGGCSGCAAMDELA